jgi:hypothetical protein
MFWVSRRTTTFISRFSTLDFNACGNSFNARTGWTYAAVYYMVFRQSTTRMRRPVMVAADGAFALVDPVVLRWRRWKSSSGT